MKKIYCAPAVSITEVGINSMILSGSITVNDEGGAIVVSNDLIEGAAMGRQNFSIWDLE
ncbi:MAG: hypothetical protein IJ559_03095 [Prevotella sp.]|nr:hypothetical protein [Prevotella sp.]